jgi:uncharacterized Zn ribbon protein
MSTEHEDDGREDRPSVDDALGRPIYEGDMVHYQGDVVLVDVVDTDGGEVRIQLPQDGGVVMPTWVMGSDVSLDGEFDARDLHQVMVDMGYAPVVPTQEEVEEARKMLEKAEKNAPRLRVGDKVRIVGQDLPVDYRVLVGKEGVIKSINNIESYKWPYAVWVEGLSKFSPKQFAADELMRLGRRTPLWR